MKVAVVGGGIFGTTISWFLAKNNHHVDLFEKNNDLFKAASGINQLRFHRGYHYPRSRETILSCINSQKTFTREYKEAVMDDGSIEHYFCIPKENSLTPADKCLEVWTEHNLEYERVDLDLINKDKIELIVKVKEYLFDSIKLKELCWEKLKEHNVNVMLNTEAKSEDFKNYDLVIIATYATNNSLLNHIPKAQKDYQFELCEKLVLKLPERFKNKSVVILDGPFMCIDPYGKSGLFLMGDVVYAIHNRNIGKHPEVPEEFKNLLNNGIIKNPPITNFKKFIESASEFFPGIEEAEHIGSMYTFRTVLPNREHDDARPTLLNKIDDKTYEVFSGKIGTCVDVAEDILKIANNMSKSKEE